MTYWALLDKLRACLEICFLNGAAWRVIQLDRSHRHRAATGQNMRFILNDGKPFFRKRPMNEQVWLTNARQITAPGVASSCHRKTRDTKLFQVISILPGKIHWGQQSNGLGSGPLNRHSPLDLFLCNSVTCRVRKVTTVRATANLGGPKGMEGVQDPPHRVTVAPHLSGQLAVTPCPCSPLSCIHTHSDCQ